LIRVTIQGGEMKIDGKHRRYQPVSFKIANGEIKKIEIVNSENKFFPRTEDLIVGYQDGTLLIDIGNRSSKKAFHIVYEKEWKKGKVYVPVNTESRLKFHNVQISIEIIPHLKAIK
jgi:hypothetical protein